MYKKLGVRPGKMLRARKRRLKTSDDKIPGVYLSRPMPVWEDTTQNVNEIEMTLSRQSDILRKNPHLS